MHRAVLRGQDDRIPDDFQGLVPVGLAGGDFFGGLAPLRLEFVTAKAMLPIGYIPAERPNPSGQDFGLAFAIALVAAFRHW